MLLKCRKSVAVKCFCFVSPHALDVWQKKWLTVNTPKLTETKVDIYLISSRVLHLQVSLLKNIPPIKIKETSTQVSMLTA